MYLRKGRASDWEKNWRDTGRRGVEEVGGRRGIPPTKSLVERLWGLGCSQETVVAPSQASHQAALGHPVTARPTHRTAWRGQTHGAGVGAGAGRGGGIASLILVMCQCSCTENV